MSNSLVPLPSNAEKSEMARLMRIMSGDTSATNESVQAQYTGGNPGSRRPLNESYAPPPPIYIPGGAPSRADVDAMKNLMEKINTLTGDDAPQPVLTETATQAALPSPTASTGFSVISMIQESGGKEVSRFNVVDSNRRDVLEGLVLREAATAVMRLMNKGHALDSARVQEVVELEETFNRNRILTGQNKSRYSRAMELGEVSAAQVFKERHTVSKANALAAQDEIKSILETIR
jgi:hypothetical protein